MPNHCLVRGFTDCQDSCRSDKLLLRVTFVYPSMQTGPNSRISIFISSLGLYSSLGPLAGSSLQVESPSGISKWNLFFTWTLLFTY